MMAGQRQKAHPRPGQFCEYRWSLSDATRMDERGLLVGEVRNRINQMLGALRAPALCVQAP